MSLETRARYSLVARYSDLANACGLECGDVLAVFADGSSAILRAVANGPPLALRARIWAEGTLTPLEPGR